MNFKKGDKLVFMSGNSKAEGTYISHTGNLICIMTTFDTTSTLIGKEQSINSVYLKTPIPEIRDKKYKNNVRWLLSKIIIGVIILNIAPIVCYYTIDIHGYAYGWFVNASLVIFGGFIGLIDIIIQYFNEKRKKDKSKSQSEND